MVSKIRKKDKKFNPGSQQIVHKEHPAEKFIEEALQKKNQQKVKK